MKLDINKIELKKISDNIFQIYHDGTILKFNCPTLLSPFGIDTEYNKQLLRLELDEKNNSEIIHFKKVILHIENLIKKKLEVTDDQFKSVIRKRNNKCDILELRLKTMKNRILTDIEFQDKDNNYLKTIYDLPKQSYLKVNLEINGLWDYRTDKKENNKCGLIVYTTKVFVLV
jgi:hypothetical protein